MIFAQLTYTLVGCQVARVRSAVLIKVQLLSEQLWPRSWPTEKSKEENEKAVEGFDLL